MTFNDAHFDAFMTFIFDAPPIGLAGPSVASADLNRPDVLPEVTLDGAVWSITGVTPSGWFALAGRGWCRFTCGADALSAITIACRPLQHLLVSDYHAFRVALSRSVAQDDKTRMGGLPVVTLAVVGWSAWPTSPCPRCAPGWRLHSTPTPRPLPASR